MTTVPPQPDDVVAWVTVRHHATGAISVSGTIGDPRYARTLLDHAKDAIGRQVRESGIVVPSRDVDADTLMPRREMGDIPIAQRGDP